MGEKVDTVISNIMKNKNNLSVVEFETTKNHKNSKFVQYPQLLRWKKHLDLPKNRKDFSPQLDATGGVGAICVVAWVMWWKSLSKRKKVKFWECRKATKRGQMWRWGWCWVWCFGIICWVRTSCWLCRGGAKCALGCICMDMCWLCRATRWLWRKKAVFVVEFWFLLGNFVVICHTEWVSFDTLLLMGVLSRRLPSALCPWFGQSSTTGGWKMVWEGWGDHPPHWFCLHLLTSVIFLHVHLLTHPEQCINVWSYYTFIMIATTFCPKCVEVFSFFHQIDRIMALHQPGHLHSFDLLSVSILKCILHYIANLSTPIL